MYTLCRSIHIRICRGICRKWRQNLFALLKLNNTIESEKIINIYMGQFELSNEKNITRNNNNNKCN